MAREYAKTPRRGSRTFAATVVVSTLVLLVAGCAVAPPEPAGPIAPAVVRQEPWDPHYPRTRCLVTPHYRIYTDIDDPELLDQFAQLMEGAYGQYQVFAPGIPLSPQPLRCFIFAQRDVWAEFTAKNTGKDAAVYLRISRGAYTVDDWFVAFWIGDRGTCAVAAHEGWHQFVARNYVGRIAPAIEEGIACTFEDVEWDLRLPRWNIGAAPSRRRALRDALDAKTNWPLQKLLQLHAGDIITLPRRQIDTFYAQTWALAMFLWEGDGGRYRAAFQQYMAEVAAGTAYRPAHLAHLAQRQWNPHMGGPQLEHYLGISLTELERRYLDYCRDLASPSE